MLVFLLILRSRKNFLDQYSWRFSCKSSLNTLTRLYFTWFKNMNNRRRAWKCSAGSTISNLHILHPTKLKKILLPQLMIFFVNLFLPKLEELLIFLAICPSSTPCRVCSCQLKQKFLQLFSYYRIITTCHCTQVTRSLYTCFHQTPCHFQKQDLAQSIFILNNPADER